MQRDCVCLNTTSKTASKWIVKEDIDSTQRLLVVGTSTSLFEDSEPSEHFVRFEHLRPRLIWHWRCRPHSLASRWVGCLSYPASSFCTQRHTRTHTHTHTVMYRRNSVMSVIADSLHCFSLVSHNHLGHSAVEEIHSSKWRTSLVH